MKLIVGLGNIDKKYKWTRHNFGFIIIDKLIQNFKLYKKIIIFNSILWKMRINDEIIFFIKPKTYINLSGENILKIQHYYNINIYDIIIIYDDINISFGKIKLKLFESTKNTHNGIKNIINHLKTNNFKIIRLGIGLNNNINIKDWVLGKFNKEEIIMIHQKIAKIVYQIIYKYLILNYSFTKLMNLYNKK